MHPTKDAVTFLNQALLLPATGREQDWDVEMADPHRAEEFMAYLENHALDQDRKFALMSLILASLEDLAQVEEVAPELWKKVEAQLRLQPALYAGLVAQWGPKNDDPDGFAISPLMSSLSK